MSFTPSRRAAILAILAVTVGAMLVGCTGVPSTPAASVTPTKSGPTASPSPTEAPLAGTCGPADGASPGLATSYTVLTSDSTTPVTMTYMTFNKDGTLGHKTETVTGPVVTRIGYPCTDAAASAIWTFTVQAPAGSDVGCVLAFGDAVDKTDSPADTGRTTMDCSSNPGYE